MQTSDLYKNKLRVRVCGVLQHNDQLLLVKLRSPVTGLLIWIPPGGGLKFGETIEQCLEREFIEETGFKIVVREHLFIHELIEPPFHAVELYYRVERVGGELRQGVDPEHSRQHQLIQRISWIPLSSLSEIPLVPEELKNYLS